MNIKITLAAARVNAGMTQEEVARELKVSKNKVVNWEKGRTDIKPQELGYLAKLFGIDEDYIFLPTSTT